MIPANPEAMTGLTAAGFRHDTRNPEAKAEANRFGLFCLTTVVYSERVGKSYCLFLFFHSRFEAASSVAAP